MKVHELVEWLKGRDQNADVEFQDLSYDKRFRVARVVFMNMSRGTNIAVLTNDEASGKGTRLLNPTRVQLTEVK